jgi:hypothetical protein
MNKPNPLASVFSVDRLADAKFCQNWTLQIAPMPSLQPLAARQRMRGFSERFLFCR